MKSTFLLSLLVFVAEANSFEPRCGDCWCAVGAEGGECPEFTEGLTSGFSEAIADAFASHVLRTNAADLPRLSTSDDVNENCYPFEHVGKIGRLPQSSSQPGCGVPAVECGGETDEQVCAFRYLTEGTVVGETCQGREYEMITYASAQCAEADGAVVTHTGPCGVCSSAQDLAVMGGTVDTLAKESLICSAKFYSMMIVGQAVAGFDSMTDCYQELGYSRSCATLWSYSSAVHSLRCENICLEERAGNTDPELNGPPPNCTISKCLQCTEGLTAAEFELFGGRSNQNSGIVAKVARPCGTFSAVIHDPCAPTAPQTPSSVDPSCQCSRKITGLTTAGTNTTGAKPDGGVGDESSTSEGYRKELFPAIRIFLVVILALSTLMF